MFGFLVPEGDSSVPHKMFSREAVFEPVSRQCRLFDDLSLRVSGEQLRHGSAFKILPEALTFGLAFQNTPNRSLSMSHDGAQ